MVGARTQKRKTGGGRMHEMHMPDFGGSTLGDDLSKLDGEFGAMSVRGGKKTKQTMGGKGAEFSGTPLDMADLKVPGLPTVSGLQGNTEIRSTGGGKKKSSLYGGMVSLADLAVPAVLIAAPTVIKSVKKLKSSKPVKKATSMVSNIVAKKPVKGSSSTKKAPVKKSTEKDASQKKPTVKKPSQKKSKKN